MPLTHSELLQLQRLSTPTVYNGWEQITQHDRRKHTNIRPTHDFMPQFLPMVGYAVTVVIEPSNPEHPRTNPEARRPYREYLASLPGPKIVVVQDLDRPHYIGSFWGEVNSNTHRALGCVGTITDGCIRDVAEITSAGFKALAAHLCVGHAYVHPVRWNCEVEVFGCTVQPGQLIHADQHGFLAVPPEDEARLLEAALFMDKNECDTVIAAARGAAGKPMPEVLAELEAAAQRFGAAAQERFGQRGEW